MQSADPAGRTTRPRQGGGKRMSIKYQTVVTCDRCDGETRYDSRGERD